MAFDFKKMKMQQVYSPPTMVIYGGPGIGKTAFSIGAAAGSDYRVGSEEHLLVNIDFRGGDRLVCHRASDIIERPIMSSGDINELIDILIANKDEIPYKWVVFDDMSTLEELFVKEVCQQHGVDELKKIEYGRGFELAKNVWQWFFSAIKRLQENCPVGVILIAHTKVENQKDPMSETFSRYDLQLDKRSREIIKKSVDIIGFAHRKTYTATKKEDGFGKETKVAVGVAERVLTFSPDIESFESKDRFNLPTEIPLDWNCFLAEFSKSIAQPETKKMKKGE